MFAVPGWSVSSTALKTQTVNLVKQADSKPASDGSTVQVGQKAGGKRKRSGRKASKVDVNASNLEDLWKTYIEGHGNSKPDATNHPEKVHTEKTARPNRNTENVAASEESQRPSKKSKNQKSSSKPISEGPQEPRSLEPRSLPVPKAPNHSIPSQSSGQDGPKLTALQTSMRQKLISARFRHLNQSLYTNPSSQSVRLFQENPEMFQEYHEGFRRQVEIWPENPVDSYIKQIKQRGAQHRASNPNFTALKAHPFSRSAEILPLPRTHGACRIADLGCGDAFLAQSLEKEKKKMRLHIHSFDLQSPNSFVTKADIANLPLEKESMDVAIFCLALMGTNWVDFIEEAFRILRWKGELWIAEIKSRFVRNNSKPQRPDHSVGYKKKVEKKASKKMEEDADDEELLEELDGHERKEDVDVSAFIEVLKSRGFILHSPDAIDTDNKMFVKMSFIKATTPTKGRYTQRGHVTSDTGTGGWKGKSRNASHPQNQESTIDETMILKPCVYKLR